MTFSDVLKHQVKSRPEGPSPPLELSRTPHGKCCVNWFHDDNPHILFNFIGFDSV